MNKIYKINHKLQFWSFIAFRYIQVKNKNGKFNLIFITLFLGISLGLSVLIVVLGIMNGFQENHISRKIEIGSFHVVMTKKNDRSMRLAEVDELKSLLYDGHENIQAVIPFTDREILLRVRGDFFNDDQGIKLRAIDPEEVKKDSRFMKFFHLKKGDLKLDNETIILGQALFDRISVIYNKEIFITPDINLRSLKNEGVPFRVTDSFTTGSYTYDRYWAFISIYSLKYLSGKTELDGIGIKLHDTGKARKVLSFLKEQYGDTYRFQTAEEINRAYFTALKVEKIMIIFLFLLIFFMVATNTFGAIKLTILEKKVDISILKAVGASINDIQVIYVIESLVIGFCGSFFGTFLGTFIAYNINSIFTTTEFVINKILTYVTFLLEKVNPHIYFEPVKIYDFSIYYQSSFPVKINLSEIIIVSFFIIIMSALAAYIPVRKASKLKPNQILKN